MLLTGIRTPLGIKLYGNDHKVLEETAKKLIELCSHGLTKGLGENEPGQMCVMQAVSIANGEEFTDSPDCVDSKLRKLCIQLNDRSLWTDKHERSQYLTPIAIASLGTQGMDDVTKMASKSSKEYEEKCNLFEDEHDAKCKPFLDEYEEKCKPFWDEYEEKCKLILAEYEAKSQPIWDEYKAKCKPFWNEYKAKCKQLLITTCEALLAELIRLETPGSKFLYLLEEK